MYISYIKRKRNRNIEDFRKRIFLSFLHLVLCLYHANINQICDCDSHSRISKFKVLKIVIKICIKKIVIKIEKVKIKIKLIY